MGEKIKAREVKKHSSIAKLVTESGLKPRSVSDLNKGSKNVANIENEHINYQIMISLKRIK